MGEGTNYLDTPFKRGLCKCWQRGLYVACQTEDPRRKPITGCAEFCKGPLNEFFKKALENVPGNETAQNCVKLVAQMAEYLARNTREYVKLRKWEEFYLSKIFDEMNALLEEAWTQTEKTRASFEKKMGYINTVLKTNTCDGEIHLADFDSKPQRFRNALRIRSYKSLWKIIHNLLRC